MSYPDPNSEFGARSYGQKIVLEGVDLKLSKWSAEQPNGHLNGPNNPIGCLYQTSCKIWMIWLDSDHSLGTYSEGSMLHASSLGNQKPDQETRLFCYCSRLDFISTLINSLFIIYAAEGVRSFFYLPNPQGTFLFRFFVSLSVSHFLFMVTQ